MHDPPLKQTEAQSVMRNIAMIKNIRQKHKHTKEKYIINLENIL